MAFNLVLGQQSPHLIKSGTEVNETWSVTLNQTKFFLPCLVNHPKIGVTLYRMQSNVCLVILYA